MTYRIYAEFNCPNIAPLSITSRNIRHVVRLRQVLQLDPRVCFFSIKGANR